MTVANDTARKNYSGDGTTSSFSTNPVIFYDSDTIDVQVVTTATGGAVTLVENTDYTISGGDGAIGTVDMSAGSSPYGAPSASEYVVLIRQEPYLQDDDFVNNSASDAEVAESRVDKLTMEIQQLLEITARSIKFPDIETAAVTLPNYVDRADKFLYFDANGDLAVSDGSLDTAISDFSYTLLDDTTQLEWQTTLGLVIGTNVQAYSADLTAIAALDKTDGNFIVANGSAWVVETGNTARTSLGLGTGDSPTFTAVTAIGAGSSLHTLTVVTGGVTANNAASSLHTLTVVTGGVTANNADSSFASSGETVIASGATTVAATGAAGSVRVDTTLLKFRFHDGSSWQNVSADGGRATMWIPAKAWTPNTTNGPAGPTDNESTTNDVMYTSLDFDQTTSESAQVQIVMPKSWDLGVIQARPLWTAASGSGTATWDFSGVALANDDAIDTAFGTAVGVTDTLITAGDMHLADETGDITIANTPADFSFIVLKVARNISDSLSADGQFLGAHVYINLDAGNDD